MQLAFAMAAVRAYFLITDISFTHDGSFDNIIYSSYGPHCGKSGYEEEYITLQTRATLGKNDANVSIVPLVGFHEQYCMAYIIVYTTVWIASGL